MIVLPKIYTREFSLCLFQLWGKRYKHIFGNDVSLFPRNISLFQNGVGKAYRHPGLNEAMNALLLELLREDSDYIRKSIREFRREIKKLANFCKRTDLNRQKLREFLALLFDCWQGFYMALYVYPDKRFNQQDRELCLQFRKETGDLEYVAFNHIETVLKKIYPDLGELIQFITLDEILNNILPRQEILSKRQNKKIIIIDDEISSENKLKKLQTEYVFELERSAKISLVQKLKGQIACEGKVKGRVRVLYKKSQIEEFQKGEILVTIMTTPEFLPAMYKAVAFITDEGGITCHAAIVARELKKPCIIGTKIATQVLKDGDMVEVDANMGTVKILKRRKSKSKKEK